MPRAGPRTELHTGTGGRIENAQVAVYLAYAGRGGHAMIDRGLYLPASWTEERYGLRRAAQGLAAYREHAPAVRALVESSPELRERELVKMATTIDAVVDVLTRRGVPRRTGNQVARVAAIAFDLAWRDWSDHPRADFGDLMRRAVAELGDVLAQSAVATTASDESRPPPRSAKRRR